MRYIFEFIVLFLDNITQKKNFSFIKKNVSPNFENFFDIGFHKGETSALANKFFKIKKIFAFEPNGQILKKVNKKKFSNVVLVNKGVGKENCVKEFNQNNFSPINSFKDFNPNAQHTKFKNKILSLIYFNPSSPPNKKISITTLEKYCNEKKIEKIDFLKIDTQGYELEVLKGLKKKISIVNLILFEHHFDKSIRKNYKFGDINNFLIKKGFKKIFKNKMIFRKIFEYIYINQKNNF